MRRGQVALYLVMTLLVLAVLACMNVWIYVAIRNKNTVQNAGDAAAIAAATEQGRLLNRIGELNLEHIVTADPARLAEIESEQRHLCLLGPVQALTLASEAARREGVADGADYSTLLRDRVEQVLQVYAASTEPTDPYPPSWEGAWSDYAAALSAVANNGLATGPDNNDYYDSAAGHILYNDSFYAAVRGEAWCWFHFNAAALLDTWKETSDWPPLEGLRDNSCVNSEVFSLHLKVYRGPLTQLMSREEIRQLLYAAGTSALPSESAISEENGVWFLYDDSFRREWSEIKGDFPVVGEPRAEYDYLGCAAVCRVEKENNHWSAAARPFGALEAHGLVTPVFGPVRLIPLDAARGGSLGTADRPWVEHVAQHVPAYLQLGLSGLVTDCTWCQALRTWENDVWRARGRTWLRFNSETCRRGGNGASGSGGTAHGH